MTVLNIPVGDYHILLDDLDRYNLVIALLLGSKHLLNIKTIQDRFSRCHHFNSTSKLE